MTRRLSGPVPYLGRLAVAVQIVAALAFVAVLLGAEGVTLPFSGSGQLTLRADFADVGGIHGGELTPVLLAGVPIGKVTGVQVTRGVALVTMSLGSSARGVVRSDATASVEPRSALEDMTIDITPGSSAAPPAASGTLIPVARTTSSTTLDQVISVLDSGTRAQLEILLSQLSRGLGGQSGRLSAAVDQLSSLLNPTTAVTSALARRRVLLSELVDSLSRLGTAAQEHDSALAQALRDAARTLSVTSGRESELAASVQTLPSTLASLDHAVTGVRTLARPLVPTLRGLLTPAESLPAALASVRQLVPRASALVRTAGTFAAQAGPGLSAVTSVLSSLGPTASALTPAIARMQPIVGSVNQRRQGIKLLGERFSGVLSTNDANGPILRGLGSFEPFNPADFGFSSSSSAAARHGAAAQAARALTLTCLHGQLVACLVRYLIPGLPGGVR
jgi:phospholipid/cholesterol/gamma-HCH transport system substrate-binding protein